MEDYCITITMTDDEIFRCKRLLDLEWLLDKKFFEARSILTERVKTRLTELCE